MFPRSMSNRIPSGGIIYVPTRYLIQVPGTIFLIFTSLYSNDVIIKVTTQENINITTGEDPPFDETINNITNIPIVTPYGTPETCGFISKLKTN